MLHLSIFVCKRDDRGNELSMSLLIIGGFFLWLAWVLALSGLNSVVYTYTMDPQYWLRLLRTGVSFQDILAGDSAPLDVNTNTCSVSLEYTPGASLCSTAIAISFFAGLFLLITCCCGTYTSSALCPFFAPPCTALGPLARPFLTLHMRFNTATA